MTEAKSRNFRQMLEAQWARGNFVCVGLDVDLSKIPESVRRDQEVGTTIRAFNRAIVEATEDLVCAYKPNFAFYLQYGIEGLVALQHTITAIKILVPDVPVILDAKFADIGSTNNGYVEFAFDIMQADAVTVNPYLGGEALQPFLDRTEKGIIVLCHTSNPGAVEFQHLALRNSDILVDLESLYVPIYQIVANHVANDWNKNGNCAVVVGSTYADELRVVRGEVGDLPILIPGIGAQGGDVERTVLAGKDSRGRGMIVNSSRGIIYASKGADFAEAARRETEKLRNLINQYRE